MLEIKYKKFVEEGIKIGKRSDLTGGRLGGWENVAALRMGREAYPTSHCTKYQSMPADSNFENTFQETVIV